MYFLRRSCLNVISIKDSLSVQQFLAVVMMSEGNQDLSRKSSDCKIYVVLNRNIEMKITTDRLYLSNNKTNDLILNLTPENVTQHSRIVTTAHKGSSTPTKMSKIIGRQIH